MAFGACYCSVASQARYPVNAAQRLQAQGPQPTQQIWLMPFHYSLAELNHTSHSQDWNSDGKMLRTFLSLWCWGSALVTIQPSSSGYHQIFLTMVQDHLISNTAWPLTEGCCPCFFPLWGTWTPCMWCCSLWDCWELVGKACALAQDRLHTGKWELSRNSSDGWYTHPFPSTE